MNNKKTHTIKRISDGKLFQVYCLAEPNEEDFEINFYVFKDENWVIDNSVCSPEYSFYVPENELKQIGGY